MRGEHLLAPRMYLLSTTVQGSGWAGKSEVRAARAGSTTKGMRKRRAEKANMASAARPKVRENRTRSNPLCQAHFNKYDMLLLENIYDNSFKREK